MRRKILKSMSMAALLAIILVAVVSAFIYYKNFEKRILKDEKNIGGIIISAVEQEGTEYLWEMGNQSDYHITYLDKNGELLYDSKMYDGTRMSPESTNSKSYSGRPEVKDAFKYGSGKNICASAALLEKTYYYAKRLEDGTVLCVAVTDKSEAGLFIELIPMLVFAAAVIIFFAYAVSKHQIKCAAMSYNDSCFNHERRVADEISLSDEIPYARCAPSVKKTDYQGEIAGEHTEDVSLLKKIGVNVGEGLMVIDRRGKLLSCNHSAKELLELESGRYIQELSMFQKNKNLIMTVEEAIAGKRAKCRLNKNQRIYQVLASPIMTDGEFDRAVVFIFDTTERVIREKFQREFSANVSHELKTPLTSISGYAEILESGMVKKDEILKFAGTIHSEALRLICLIEDIIEISRMDENQTEQEWRMVDLKELAEENIADLQSAADEKEILVVLKGENRSVCGVRQILNQMIHNLIENAIKYNKKNGSVEVWVSGYGSGVLFSVKDTGIGIAQQDQERVFERFYRVDKSRSNSITGTGLGLSIVKDAAIYHHAKIEIESELDMGTEIRVIFGAD